MFRCVSLSPSTCGKEAMIHLFSISEILNNKLTKLGKCFVQSRRDTKHEHGNITYLYCIELITYFFKNLNKPFSSSIKQSSITSSMSWTSFTFDFFSALRIFCLLRFQHSFISLVASSLSSILSNSAFS